MTAPEDDIRADLEPGVDESVVVLGARLREARPLPRPAFRGELGRRLAARADPSNSNRLRARIMVYAASGLTLLSLGAVSAGGLGPLG